MHKDKAVTLFNPDYTLENILRPEKSFKVSHHILWFHDYQSVNAHVPDTVHVETENHKVA